MDLSSLDDIALMALIAQAQNDALGQLYDRYGRLVFSVALHVIGDSETAEEITQDVFTRVWDGAHTYRPELAQVRSWMISITRHRAIDELRRRGVRPDQHQADWPEFPEDDFPAVEGPEDLVEARLWQRIVRTAVAALPEDQRRVLGLAFFQGYSHSEIAERLNEPLGTVKSRIRLAMQKLRQTFTEQGLQE